MRVMIILVLAVGTRTSVAARVKNTEVGALDLHLDADAVEVAASPGPRCGGELFAYLPGAGSQVQYQKDGEWKDGTLFGQEKDAKDGELRVMPTGWKTGYHLGPVRRMQNVATLVMGSKAEAKFSHGWIPATIVDITAQGIFRVHPDDWEDDSIFAKDSTEIRVPSDGIGVPPPECVLELGIGSCVEVQLSSGKWEVGRIVGRERPESWKVMVSGWKSAYSYDVKKVRPAAADTMTVGTEVSVNTDPKKPRQHALITGVHLNGEFLVLFDDWSKSYPHADIVKFIHLSDAANAAQDALESVQGGSTPVVCDYFRRGEKEAVQQFAQQKGFTLKDAAMEELCNSLSGLHDVC